MNRRGNGAGRGVDALAGMHGDGFDFHFAEDVTNSRVIVDSLTRASFLKETTQSPRRTFGVDAAHFRGK
jgi:hypothetical protein